MEEERHQFNRKSTNPFDSNDSPFDSDTSDIGMDSDRIQLSRLKPSEVSTKKFRDTATKQLDELYTNDRLPESIIFLFTSLHQSNVGGK